jgi:hypothetical protein
MLKRAEDIPRRHLGEEQVVEGVFKWLDGYIQKRMRWCTDPGDLWMMWCEGAGVDHRILPRYSTHNRIAEFLECEINDMLTDYLPGRTWRMLSMTRLDTFGFVIHVGRDYRIVDWMEQHGYTENDERVMIDV